MRPDNSLPCGSSERGFLMPVALFIIVIMGVFALTLWRTSVQTSGSVVQELISIQAFYAAESGAQWGMAELFFCEDSAECEISNINSRCGNSGQPLTFVAGGLSHCIAEITCEYEDITDPEGSFYTIRSEGQCSSGDVMATRTVAVQAVKRDEE